MKKWIISSFRNRILASILIITMLPILLCNVLMLQFQVHRTTNNQNREATAQTQKCTEALTAFCNLCQRVSEDLGNGTALHSVLRQNVRDSGILYQVLMRDTQQINDLARVDICLSTGECCYSTEHTLPAEIMDPEWGVLYASSQTKGLAFRRGADSDSALQAARAVCSYDGDVLGYIVITVSRENLDAVFSGCYADPCELDLLDSCWEPVYSSRPARAKDMALWLRNQALNGLSLERDASEESKLYIAQEPTTGFYLVLQQPVIFNHQAMTTFHTISLVLGTLCLGLCLTGALALSLDLASPIHKMDRVMGCVEQGDFSARMETGREDELGHLAKSFNRMVEEYQTNLIRSVQNQRELNDAQVRMMQAQLNPHFLYNTLDSMKWMGITNHVPQIADLATDLAALLRATINAEEFFTLEQELELVERYLDIQYIRFEDRFVCEVEVDECYQHCLVPKLILQPLVENAIIHGVVNQEDGYIKIMADSENDDLILIVQDNGCGFPEKILEQLNVGLPHAMGKHLGLFNVNQILRLHYGSDYGIFAQNLSGGGCRVQLRLPMNRKDF